MDKPIFGEIHDLNIALLTDGITPYVMGGMQRHSFNLAKYLTLQGANVILVHCVSEDSNIPTVETVNKEIFGSQSNESLAKIIGLTFPKKGKIPGHYIRNSYRYSCQVWDSINDLDIDYVYAKGFAGWKTIKERKKKNFNTQIGVKFHGYEMYQYKPYLKQKLENLILKRPTKWNNLQADHVFSYGGKISHIIENLGVPSDKIIEYTSGIDPKKVNLGSLKPQEDVVKFVFMGRNEARKGTKEIFMALNELIKTKLKFEFNFIGPVNHEELSKDSRINFLGEKNNLDEILSILDNQHVLVCPSHSEGMPNVIIEGMARGLFILTTDVGAINAIVSDENGKFVEPANFQSLMEALKNICELPKETVLQKRLKSIEIVKDKLDWNVIAKGIIADIKLRIGEGK